MIVPPFLAASRRLVRRGATVLTALVLALGAGTRARSAAPAALIDSGTPWLDSDGRPINAHAGGLLFHDGTYYWYGEIKTGETTLPACNADWGGTRVPLAGVSCYASTDLLHWRNLGNVLPANPDIPELHPNRVLERPKVIFNRAHGTFVMWMHIDSIDYKEARTGVAVATSPAGPFRFVGSLRPDAGVIPEDMPEPLRQEFATARAKGTIEAWAEQHPEWKIWARDFAHGQMARDMALFVDDDGAAYQFYASEENAVMHLSRLSDDYLSHAGKYRRIAFDSREAPAPFKWNGRYYLVSSGCTGWDPNSTHLHSADTLLGNWTDHGSLFAEDSSAARVSYLSQSTFVAPVEGRGLLYMADRWEKHDLQQSRYVWLPLEIAGAIPHARWRQVWDLAELRAPSASGASAAAR
jgi:beta-galactosidase